MSRSKIPSQRVAKLKSVNAYMEELFCNEPEEVITACNQGLPQIEAPPIVRSMLRLLVTLSKPKSILEIGTLGGATALTLSKAAKEAKITTVEANPDHAQVARQTLANYPVDVIEGLALDIVPNLKGPFDFVFLDADWDDYAHLIDQLIELCTPGALILVDNMIRNGKVVTPPDEKIERLDHFNRLVASHPKLQTTILPYLGGFHGGSIDGLLVCEVVGDKGID